ncbi:MAG TPA: hypothetical protein VIY52_06345 [Streptosporangiaceae bacterium]
MTGKSGHRRESVIDGLHAVPEPVLPVDFRATARRHHRVVCRGLKTEASLCDVLVLVVDMTAGSELRDVLEDVITAQVHVTCAGRVDTWALVAADDEPLIQVGRGGTGVGSYRR